MSGLRVAAAFMGTLVAVCGCGQSCSRHVPEPSVDVRANGLANAEASKAATSANVQASAATIAPTTQRRFAKVDAHGHYDGELAGPAMQFLKAHGIGAAVNLSGGTAGEGLEESLAASRATGGYYIVFANIDFTGIGTKGWAAREVAGLERAKALGVKGVKIPKSLGLGVRFPDGRRVPVDDPVLDPVFDAMARLKLPLSIHVGDPKAFFEPVSKTNERFAELASHPSWSFADRSRFPTWEGLYGEFERRVKRSKSTTIVGVHFGNAPEDPALVGRMLDQYPNFYVDTAARIPEIGRRPAETRRVILEHPDRVLFGTDLQIGVGMLVLGAGPPRGHAREDVERFFSASWRFFETNDRQFAHPTPIQGDWAIDGIALPDDVLEKVYHLNAERLLGLPPTAVVEGGP